MKKLSPLLIAFFAAANLTACVSQNYEKDNNTPVIENEASRNEKAMTRIQLGLGYLKMGNTQQAKLNLEKAKRFSPNLVQVYTAFAHYYDSVGEPNLATTSYEHALSLDSDDADTLNNYGVFLCRQEKFELAEQKILQAIAVPSYILVAQSYENLALCQLKAKQFVKAEVYLEKAIAHSPNRASSLLQMMRLQYAKSDYKLAQTYLYRYEKSTRRFSADALALAFKIYDKQRNKRIAKNYANMLVKMFPNSFQAKQYILNELHRIEADKLASEYRLSMGSSNTKTKKRVVMLSPKKNKTAINTRSESASLSQHGLQPIMANSVMPNEQQKQQALAEQQNEVKTNRDEITPKQATVTKAEEKVTDEGNTDLKPELVTKKNSSALTNTPEKKAESKVINGSAVVSLPVHFVKKGDSLFSISKRYNIVMKSLERWNKLRRPYLLKIGDVVYLADPKAGKAEQN